MLSLPFLSYGGLASCALAALLGFLGHAKGRQARQLGAAVQVDNLAELKQLWAMVPLLIAVTGRVLAPKPYKCEMSDSEAAIVEMREERKGERRAAPGSSTWVADSQLLRESVRETEWGLGDGSGAELPVEGGRHARGDFLQMSGDRLIPESSGLMGRTVEQVLGMRTIGVRQVERMLPVGTMLTAVGELSPAVDHPSAFKGAARHGNKMLVLRQPPGGPFLLSRQPLPELVSSLQATCLACQQWSTAFAALGSSMLVAAAAQHALTWLRVRRLRQRRVKALRRQGAAAAGAGGAAGGQEPAAAAGEAGGQARSAVCVVCLERACDSVFATCGHMCTCSRCGAGLRRCPICRSRGAPIRVYTP